MRPSLILLFAQENPGNELVLRARAREIEIMGSWGRGVVMDRHCGTRETLDSLHGRLTGKGIGSGLYCGTEGSFRR